MGPQLVANLGYAAMAGVAAAIVMGMLGYVVRLFGIKLDFPFILGSFFTKAGENGKSYAIGTILHLGLGAIYALSYIILYMGINVNPTWQIGLLFGFGHGLLSGVILGSVGEEHPQMGESKAMSKPGIFVNQWGLPTTVVFVALHMIFGLVMVLLYTHWFGASTLAPNVGVPRLTY